MINVKFEVPVPNEKKIYSWNELFYQKGLFCDRRLDAFDVVYYATKGSILRFRRYNPRHFQVYHPKQIAPDSAGKFVKLPPEHKVHVTFCSDPEDAA